MIDEVATDLDLPLPHGGTLTCGGRTLLMGVVNVTPDSFSDGGRHADAVAATRFAEQLIDDGADILDIGGESTRPGAAEVPAAEQLRRILPVVRALAARRPDVPLSIDTRSARVARETVAAGASIVNDVSGLTHDPDMARTVADLGAPAVVMHMRGNPGDMRQRTNYEDVVSDVLAELRELLDAARGAGVRHLIADPGIGFAKTAEQSAALLAATPRFLALGVPLLVGPSRKSFLAAATGKRRGTPARTRLHATVAAVTAAALGGAHIVRVHDVAACADAVRVAHMLRMPGGRAPEGWTSQGGAARMEPGPPRSA